MPSYLRLRLHLRHLWLAGAVLLSACGTLDQPAPEPSEQTARTHEPLAATPAVPNTPFADAPEKRTVYFGFGEARISHEGVEILRQNALHLKNDSQLVVTLVGHTDNLGSAAYNLAVADKRIEAVNDKLRSLGVAKNQLRRLPLGSEQSSKHACDSEACRQSMRKVELVYERR